MPILGIIATKIAIKAGTALSAQLLREIATNPGVRHALENVAHDMGMEAGGDVIDFILDNVENLGDILDFL